MKYNKISELSNLKIDNFNRRLVKKIKAIKNN